MGQVIFLTVSTGFFFSIGYVKLAGHHPLSYNIPLLLGISAILFFVMVSFVNRLKKIDTSPKKENLKMWLIQAGLVVIFSFIFRGIFLPLEPTLSDDIYRYGWDGHLQERGINPYQYSPSSEKLNSFHTPDHKKINHPEIKTIYPPMAQIVFRWGNHIKAGWAGQKVVFVIFDALTIFLILIMLWQREKSPLWVVIYAWNPLIIMEFAYSGHNDSLMIFFLVLGVLLFENGKTVEGSMAWAGSILAKGTSILAIPFLLNQKSKTPLFMMSIILVLSVLPFLGPSDLLSGVKTYAGEWHFNSSLFSLVSYIFPFPTVVKLLFAGFLFLLAYEVSGFNKNNPARYFLIVLFATLLLSPIVHPWYVTWLVPFLCLIPLWSGLVWSVLVMLSYLVLIPYTVNGIWNLPTWVPIIEYGLVFGILTFELKQQTPKPLIRQPIPLKKEKAFVSLIVPTLNEENAIENVIRDIPRTLVDEIIVVDNGSKDQTVSKAKAVGALVLEEKNQGYGWAVQTGLQKINPHSDIVVILDGDYSDYPEDLAKLLEPIKNNQADLVMGNRTVGAQPGALTPQQRFGNALACFLIRLFYGVSFSDMGPFRAIRTDMIKDLNMVDRNYGWNVEMQVKGILKGYRIREVPVRYRPRIGHSKISGSVKGTVMAGIVILRSIYKYGLFDISSSQHAFRRDLDRS